MTATVRKKLGFLDRGTGIVRPFHKLFPGFGIDVMKEGMDGCAAIVLWGGTDINPAYYGQKAHLYSEVVHHDFPSQRDQDEWKAMLYAKAHNIPIIGVCRGAQFLCAFAGGKLIQHVNGHNRGNHDVMCNDGVTRSVTSCHHQMMYPFDVPHVMLAWTEAQLSNTYEEENCRKVDMTGKVEPEVVYFPAVNGLAIQGHPEWMKDTDPFVEWCLDKVNEFCFNGKLLQEQLTVKEKEHAEA